MVSSGGGSSSSDTPLDQALAKLRAAKSFHFVYTVDGTDYATNKPSTSQAEGDVDQVKNAFQYTLSDPANPKQNGEWIVAGGKYYHKAASGWQETNSTNLNNMPDLGTSVDIGILVSSGVVYRYLLQGDVKTLGSASIAGQETDHYQFAANIMGGASTWDVYVGKADQSVVRLDFTQGTSVNRLTPSKLNQPVNITAPTK